MRTTALSTAAEIILLVLTKCWLAQCHSAKETTSASVEVEPSSTTSTAPLSLDDGDDKNKSLAAAKRLVASASALQMEDLKLILRELFPEHEIAALMKNSTRTCDATMTSQDNNKQEETEEEDYVEEEEDRYASFWADRHAQGILDTYQNSDCLEREFDASNPDEFDVDAAREVLETCRVLVLRNLFSSKTILHKVFPRLVQYTEDVTEGRIHSEGTTTYGGDYYILNEDEGRVNYMLPREVALASDDDDDEGANELWLANEIVLDILSHPSMLGEDMTVNHMGTLSSWPGAPAQGWHTDAQPLWGTSSSESWGVAGHDLPPYAVSLFTPLMLSQNMTNDHGPTEFCVGTSHLQGQSHGSPLTVRDPSLLENGVVHQLQAFDHFKDDGRDCPDGFRRIPLLNVGDVLLFDYMIAHRGGANQSPDLRTMLFMVYSQKWYRDSTFDNSYRYSNHEDDDDETSEVERLTQLTRFAVVEEIEEDEPV